MPISSSTCMRGLVVTLRRLDIQSAAIDRQSAAVVDKLIALGVAAEIIVVIEHEHPGLADLHP